MSIYSDVHSSSVYALILFRKKSKRKKTRTEQEDFNRLVKYVSYQSEVKAELSKLNNSL